MGGLVGKRLEAHSMLAAEWLSYPRRKPPPGSSTILAMFMVTVAGMGWQASALHKPDAPHQRPHRPGPWLRDSWFGCRCPAQVVLERFVAARTGICVEEVAQFLATERTLGTIHNDQFLRAWLFSGQFPNIGFQIINDAFSEDSPVLKISTGSYGQEHTTGKTFS